MLTKVMPATLSATPIGAAYSASQGRCEAVEQVGDVLADARAERGAGADAEQGDEHLHGGQEALGRLRQRQRDLRAPAGARHLLEADLARRHQRHFAEREKAVQHGEQDDEDDCRESFRRALESEAASVDDRPARARRRTRVAGAARARCRGGCSGCAVDLVEARFVAFRPRPGEVFAGDQVIHRFGDVGRMIADALDVLGDEQQVRADRHARRIGLHEVDQAAIDAGVGVVDRLVLRPDRQRLVRIAFAETRRPRRRAA